MLISAAEVCSRKGFMIKTGHIKEHVETFYNPETKETVSVTYEARDCYVPDYEKFRRWFFKAVCGKDYDEVKNNPRDEYFNFYCRVSEMGAQDAGYIEESLLEKIYNRR